MRGGGKLRREGWHGSVGCGKEVNWGFFRVAIALEH
jgi:hypothetical protein